MSVEKYPLSDPLPYWMAKRVPLGVWVEEREASYRACRRQASCHQAHCSEGTQLVRGGGEWTDEVCVGVSFFSGVCVCVWRGRASERASAGSLILPLFFFTHRLDDPVSKMTLNVWGGVPSEISP